MADDDAPRDAGATYWLVTGDDFSLDADPEETASRQNEIVSILPVVFRSSGGFARLYDSSCLLSRTVKVVRARRLCCFPARCKKIFVKKSPTRATVEKRASF
jgi:hypothetical protein